MTYPLGQFINGRHEHSSHGDRQELLNPANNSRLGDVQFAQPQQVEAAVSSAVNAFPSWANTPPLKRARILFKFKDLLEKHQDELATLVTQEHGKTLDDARGSVHRAIEVVEQNCTIASLLKGDYSETVGINIDSYTLRQPLGVCAGISPFNFPVMVPAWMIVPAIACGNTFILKPSEKTPAAALRLVELLHEAGLPKGVVNLVNGGKEVVDQLLTHPKIKAFTAVASTPVAEYIYQTAITNGKRAHTFGGAKNHCLVMPDADTTQAAHTIASAAFGAAGERCMALSVAVVVGDETANNLCKALSAELEQIKIGPGIEKNIDMGPLVNQAHLAKVKNYIQVGVDEGASLVADGRLYQHQSAGNFLGPTLFDRVEETMRVYQEEIFGPVLCVVRVNDFEQGLALINRHQYGNGSAIFTHDGYAARQFCHRVQAGMVGVNIPIPVPVAYHPFGGWKRSVFGDTNMHGTDSVKFYSKLKTVTCRWLKDEKLHSVFTMPSSE